MTIPKTLLLGAAFALSLSAAAQAQDQPQADQAGAKDYPPCSATVTDNCMQHEGGARAKTHRAKHSSHHRAALRQKT